jgi:hypothetical protein
VAAGFSPGEADQVRRSMAAWRRRGGLDHFRERLIGGMTERGYAREFAEQIYQQILGFGEYGFPESHAASFALLVYVSAWLKHHEPAAFFAASSTASPWASMRRPSWCGRRAARGWRCARWMSRERLGLHPGAHPGPGIRPCAWGCGWSRGCPGLGRSGW